MFFTIEGIFEGGLFVSNYWTTYGSSAFFGVIFSVYSIIALIVPFWSFFLARKISLDKEWSKKSIVFMIINILTIIISLVLVISYGIIPSI
jgi:hypothetical protein